MIAERKRSTLPVNGYDLTIERAGRGAPLLVLPGEESLGDRWTASMEALAEQYDVIIPEHPGFGNSERPPWLDNIQDLAYFYLEFLGKAKLTAVNLVGFSLGGWIAAEMATRNTGRLASLTLVGAPGVRVNGVNGVDMFMCSDDDKIRNLYYDQAVAERAIAAVRADDEDLMLKQGMMSALLSWHPRNYDLHLHKWLHLIDVPTLLLWGDSDRLFPREHAYEYQRLIPKSEVVVLERCGHLPQLEKPDEFVAALTRFLSRTVA